MLARPLPPVQQQAEREAAQPCSGRNFPTLVELCQPERLVGLTDWLTNWALQTSQQRQIVRLGRMYVNLENSK